MSAEIARLQDKSISVNSNGSHTILPDTGYTAIHRLDLDVDVKPVGNIQFYDFDGTLVTSYTGAEAQALTELPSAPDHSADTVPLTFDAWNWTLADIKGYNTSYPEANIIVGANYHTTDSKTHLVYDIKSDDDDVGVGFIGWGNGTIDWGDGTVETLRDGYYNSHLYASKGTYHCTVSGLTDLRIAYSSNQYIQARKLREIRVSSGVTSVKADQCTCLGSVSIPSTATTVSAGYCKGLNAVVLPRGVSAIGKEAFYTDSCLIVLSFPNTVTSTDMSICSYCISLENITIPSTLTSLDYYAFQYCYALKSVVLPDSITSLGSSCFYSCSALESVRLSNNLTALDGFSYCRNLKSIELPSSLNIIMSTALAHTVIESLIIPDSVTTIGMDAFYDCKHLKSVTMPNSVTTYQTKVFEECVALKSIVIPALATNISNEMFYNCNALEEITISEGVTSIGESSFINCYCMQSITLPSTIASIGSSAFSGCTMLSSVSVLATTPPTLANANAFNLSYQKKIYVPAESVEAYKAATNWSTFASIIEAIPS